MKKSFDSFYDWWKNIDKILLSIILSLFFLGLFFSLVSTSLIASDKLDTNSYYFFLKHFIFIGLSIGIIIFLSILNKEFLIKFSLLFFVITFITLVLVPFIGSEVKGSRRWLDLGFLPRFQPIELLKPYFIVLISFILTLSIKNLYIKYFFSLIILIPIVLFLITQPDLGQTLLLISVWLILVFASGANLYLLFISLFTVASITTYLVIFVEKFEYIKIRLLSFFDSGPGNNYQAERAIDAITSGGFFGKGIGEGTLNSKVPEAHTDYIVSVISEEFGAIIVLFILLFYLIFSYNVIKKISFIDSNISKLILIGSISIILLQTFVHIGVNIRMLPTTGMTLPFLSYGGSSIISSSILSGIILNITKRKII